MIKDAAEENYESDHDSWLLNMRYPRIATALYSSKATVDATMNPFSGFLFNFFTLRLKSVFVTIKWERLLSYRYVALFSLPPSKDYSSLINDRLY